VVASPFLEGVPAADVRLILAAAATRRFSSHTVVYEQGSEAREFYLLTNGRARYFVISPDGRKMLLHWLVPGDVLGAASLLADQSTYRVSAETTRECSSFVWDRATMRSLFDRYPRLLHNALTIAVGYLDLYIAAHSALVSETARQRLASVLARLADAVGEHVPDGVQLDVTNDELASAANITPFTASRILNEWQSSRALTKRRGRIVLHSPKRLFRVSA
jgi:CRP/FNR family transcriptional regulator, nitrogen oxide reductase regulator